VIPKADRYRDLDSRRDRADGSDLLSDGGGNREGDSLPDILERVLNTGVVIAGDLKIKIADVELLSIQIRLVVCSVDKAKELGIRWWWQEPEPSLAGTQTVAIGKPQSYPQQIPPPSTPWEAYQKFRNESVASPHPQPDP